MSQYEFNLIGITVLLAVCNIYNNYNLIVQEMIEHVKEQTDNMLLTLAGLEQKISKLAEVSKRTDEIDKLEKEAIEAVHNCELSFTCEYESPEKQKEHIDAFFENITNEFSVFVFLKSMVR